MYRIIAYLSLAFCLGALLDVWDRDFMVYMSVLIGISMVLLLQISVLFMNKGNVVTVYTRKISKLLIVWRQWSLGPTLLLCVALLLCMAIGTATAHDEQSSRRIAAYSLLTLAASHTGEINAVVSIVGEIESTPKSLQMPCRVLAVYTMSGLQQLPNQPIVWVQIYDGSIRRHATPGGVSQSHTIAEYYSQINELHAGAVISLFMRVKRVPKGPFAIALLRKGIMLLGDSSQYSVSLMRGGARPFWDVDALQGQLLGWIKSRVDASYGQVASTFLLSFAIGDRTEMNRQVLQVFTSLGIIHAFVASGATIRMTIAPVVTRLQKWLKISAWWYPIAICSTVMLVFCTGFAPPAVRAGIVYGYELSAVAMKRPYDRFTANAVSLVWITLIEPHLLVDPGVVLSYGAATTLALLPRKVHIYIGRVITWPSVRHVVSRGIAGQIGIMPLVAEEFGQLPYFSLLINLFLYPLLEWVIPISFVLCTIACIDPRMMVPIEPEIAQVAHILSTQILAMRAYPLSLHFTKPPIWILMMYYTAILFPFYSVTRYIFGKVSKYFV